MHGAPAAPMSPEAATTVAWWLAAARRAACRRATSVLVKHCSPPPALMEITSSWGVPSRTVSVRAVIRPPAVATAGALNKTTRIAAEGATAWIISTSSVSSPYDSQRLAPERR